MTCRHRKWTREVQHEVLKGYIPDSVEENVRLKIVGDHVIVTEKRVFSSAHSLEKENLTMYALSELRG